MMKNRPHAKSTTVQQPAAAQSDLAQGEEEERARIMRELQREMPALEVCLDLAKGVLSDQMSRASALDTKAGFILGSASLLTGVLTSWKSPPPSVLWLSILAYTVLALALGVYGWIIYNAARGYGLVEYFVPILSADLLVGNLIFQERKDAQYVMLLAIQQATGQNEATIRRKIVFVKHAFAGLWVQAAIVAVILLLELKFA